MAELYTFFAANIYAGLGLTFVFSLLVGSFLNVVIYRIPVMMEHEWEDNLAEAQGKEVERETFNLSVPRSRCGNCQHQIRWYENIPVISYLILKGKCSQCKTAISLRYPAIELLTALLSVLVIYTLGFNGFGLAAVVFTWLLIALTFIDLDHYLLPDRITLPLLWLGLLINTREMFTNLSSAVWGAAIGYLTLWSIYWLFKLLTGKEGMGYGDFKLLAALGAWCGATSLPLIILLSSVTGVVLAIVMVAFKRHEAQKPLPFGPYLAIAGWIALLWGQQITNAYLGML
ncbi:prepilin peptidase [Neptunomonas marina]|uniref:Prepilin leader peptidase/N-methyltransferase n=1 Tax=Neptunomonas marina TaxID=1815562 RepID=A0A437QC18_9GAMM|nr:A24 family peptidase [Neptunomonas marina]RVU32084.1 prepilin peptidase [Neptunomonas marina]